MVHPAKGVLFLPGLQSTVWDASAPKGRGTAKHLRLLREARLIRAVTSPDGDGRKTFHDLPSLFRSRDAAGKTILDFGAVVLRFG